MRMIMIFISLLLLTGCATVPMATAPLNQNLSWQERQAQLNKVQNFQVQGVVGIRYQQRVQSATVTLTQTNKRYDLELYGPLGADRVVLKGDSTEVTLKTSDGKITRAKTPEALLQQRLGWSLPVNNLYYWLRNLPAPNVPNKIQFDAYHHITQLQQQGWTINYLRFAGVNDTDLPTKILMKNSTISATIIVSQWDIN